MKSDPGSHYTEVIEIVFRQWNITSHFFVLVFTCRHEPNRSFSPDVTRATFQGGLRSNEVFIFGKRILFWCRNVLYFVWIRPYSRREILQNYNLVTSLLFLIAKQKELLLRSTKTVEENHVVIIGFFIKVADRKHFPKLFSSVSSSGAARLFFNANQIHFHLKGLH